MEKNEMIEKLHTQTGVSRADAEEALKKSDWDLLDALTLLEKEGKIPPLTSSMTTHTSSDGSGSSSDFNYSYSYGAEKKSSQGFSKKIGDLFNSLLSNSFVIKRRGEVLLNLPVLVMVIILLCEFKITVAALIIGLFFECQYSVDKNPEKKG